MKLNFTKMHGAGNDFVVFDACNQQVNLTESQLRFIADRRFGIGADQILLVEKSQLPDTAFRYRIFNADGGEVEQCGNGARAFAIFVTATGMTDQNPIRVETKAGVIELKIQDNNTVTVDMGKPVFNLPDIPFNPAGLTPETIGRTQAWTLRFADGTGTAKICVVSMGNPHAVQVVDNVDTASVLQQGPLIENHPAFPNRVNAGFMEIISRHHIRLRVFERGAGETLACGTGACAAVVSGIMQGKLDSPVTVNAKGGTLEIAWEGGTSHVMMTGPATIVFNGTINI